MSELNVSSPRGLRFVLQLITIRLYVKCKHRVGMRGIFFCTICPNYLFSVIMTRNHQKMHVAYLFFAAAALSLCLRFLNQFPTCVGVSPVACASSLFLLGFG